MKRLAVISITGGLLALAAAAALGATEQWSGSLKAPECGTFGTCQLSLKVKVAHGKATQVKDLAAPSTPWDCDGNPGLQVSISAPKADVHKGKFTYKSGDGGDNQLTIKGEFDKHLHNVTGTLEATHDDQFAGQCDTGKMTFKAKPAK
jgi:hypothetical protein